MVVVDEKLIERNKMKKDEKRKLIAELMEELSEKEQASYLTQFFNDCSNDFIAELSGFKNEIGFDNYILGR